jgi:TRAP-type transport system small permease protein
MLIFDRIVTVISHWFAKVGAVLLLCTFLVTLIDVIGSDLFDLPVLGSTEIIGLLQGVVIAAAIAMTQILKRHISIDILVDRLPKRTQIIVGGLVSLILLTFFIMLIWQFSLLGLSFQDKGDYSQTLRIPTHYFAYLMALAFVSSCLVFLVEFMKAVIKARS